VKRAAEDAGIAGSAKIDQVAVSRLAFVRRPSATAPALPMEVPLFVKENALLKLDPDTGSDERATLATFDAHRDRINAVADKIYSFDRQVFHVLDTSDF
jgi:hypothetical protein